MGSREGGMNEGERDGGKEGRREGKFILTICNPNLPLTVKARQLNMFTFCW